MVPTAEKRKHVRKAPDFIDDKFIATLEKSKQDYWKRRKAGKNGQEDLRPKPKFIKEPQGITMGFDNEGQMVAKTRAMRRQKPATEAKYTKATHSVKKARKNK